jgi:hypothetical protein
MAALKCPNPTCSFLFDPTKVPAGALLSCPQCAMRFKLASAPATDAKAQPSAFADVGRNERPSYSPPSWKSRLPIIGIVVLMSIGLFVFLLATTRMFRTDPITHDEQLFTDHSVAIRPPVEPWVRDRDSETALNLNLGVYRRLSPDARIGYAGQKWEGRNARNAELSHFLNDRLKRLCENLNVEERPGEEWLGQPAVKYEFRGTTKSQAVIVGECLGVSIKGIAYYFFAWAPEGEIASAVTEFDLAKARVRVLNPHRAWTEKKLETAVIAGKGTDYTLTDGERIWNVPKNSQPTDEDPLADLLLRAEIKPNGGRSDLVYKADLFAYVLPAAPDPMKAASEFVLKRKSRNPELYAEFQFEELTDPPIGDVPQGEAPAEPIPTRRWKMTHPKSPESARLIVMSAIDVNDKIVAVEATCLWRQREIWENRLVAIAGSLAKK